MVVVLGKHARNEVMWQRSGIQLSFVFMVQEEFAEACRARLAQANVTSVWGTAYK